MTTEPADSSTPSNEKLEDDHLRDFGEFFDYLNRAAKSSLPRVSRRYSEAHVLLVRWGEDDRGTVTEINDLDQVFRDLYNYQTKQYLIPSRSSANELEGALVDFKRAHDNDDNLLILYYGGHGALETFSRDRPSRSIWSAKQKGGPSLVWSDLQGVLERAESDVLFILDCCFAATAARGVAGSKEGLWACNSASTTTGVSNNSFTRNLIEELRALHTTRFNVSLLHSRLMRRYGRPGPYKLLTEPWYTYLGNEIVPSVELAPLPKREADKGTDSPATDPANSSQSSLSSSMTSLTIDNQMTETLVLLAVRLKSTEQVPERSLWHRWCHEVAPEDVESVHALGRLRTRDLIKIEGHFLSHSTLVLASVPIFIWDRTPRSSALSFIGFIKSPNLHIPLEFSMSKDMSVLVDLEDTTLRKAQADLEHTVLGVVGNKPSRLDSGEAVGFDSSLDTPKFDLDYHDEQTKYATEILMSTPKNADPAETGLAIRLAEAYIAQALKLLEHGDRLRLRLLKLDEGLKGDVPLDKLLAILLQLFRTSGRATGLNLDMSELLLLAVRQNSEDLVRQLLQLGVDVNFKATSDETPLSLAAKHGHQAVASTLLAHGAEVDLKGHSERTPLLWAAAEGQEALVNMLIDQGAAIHATDQFLRTPLSLAAKYGHSMIATLLLNRLLSDGQPDFLKSVVDWKDISRRTPLSLAAEGGHEAIASLLLSNQATVNSFDHLNITPLAWAAMKSREALARLLIRHGAEVNCEDITGRTPLAWAAYQGCAEIVKLLLDHDAEVNSRPASWGEGTMALLDHGIEVKPNRLWRRDTTLFGN